MAWQKGAKKEIAEGWKWMRQQNPNAAKDAEAWAKENKDELVAGALNQSGVDRPDKSGFRVRRNALVLAIDQITTEAFIQFRDDKILAFVTIPSIVPLSSVTAIG